MRFPVRVFLALAWSVAIGAPAWAQTAQPSGSVKTSSRPDHDQPAKSAPGSAQRQPIHKPIHARSAKTPVVRPHGPTHPHKPAATASAKAASASASKTVPAKAVPGQQPPPANAPAQPATTAAAPPAKLPDPETPEGAAAKLPRFASLRSDDVNMRAGPGTRYRIDWVYKRRDLPVEIERQFDIWRWVRDADGIQGWVHQATLMGRRSFIVQKADATLRSQAADTASAVAILKPGVIGRVRSCEAASDWCNVQVGSYRGFLRRQQFWGVFPDEAINP